MRFSPTPETVTSLHPSSLTERCAVIPTREQARELLLRYNSEPFHIKHADIVCGVMEYFACERGYGDEAEFWGTVGLLHDLDFEKYPEQHCIKVREIMESEGIDERLIHAVVSHGYGITVDTAPEHEMEKVLYAVDELTGLIGAVAIIRSIRATALRQAARARSSSAARRCSA